MDPTAPYKDLPKCFAGKPRPVPLLHNSSQLLRQCCCCCNCYYCNQLRPPPAIAHLRRLHYMRLWRIWRSGLSGVYMARGPDGGEASCSHKAEARATPRYATESDDAGEAMAKSRPHDSNMWYRLKLARAGLAHRGRCFKSATPAPTKPSGLLGAAP